MFAVASDYNTLIELLIGAIVASVYFGGRKYKCPQEISESLADVWGRLLECHSGHIPNSETIHEHFEEGGGWEERSMNRIRDAMLVMILYGVFALFYCGNCCRLGCGKIVYSVTPCGIIIDSVLIFVYYIFIGFRYGRKYSMIDKIVRILKILFSIVLLLLSLSYYKDSYINDEQTHSLATVLILLVTCSLSALVLWFFTLRNKAIARKASKLITKLSCINDALDIIKQNEDSSVIDKMKLIIEKANKEEKDIYKRKYFISLCFRLSINNIQYVSEIAIDHHDVNVYTPTKVDCDSIKISYNNCKAYSRFYDYLLHLALKTHLIYIGAVRYAKKLPNNSQLKIEKSKVFDKFLKKVLNQISIYGIPVKQTT